MIIGWVLSEGYLIFKVNGSVNMHEMNKSWPMNLINLFFFSQNEIKQVVFLKKNSHMTLYSFFCVVNMWPLNFFFWSTRSSS